MEIDRAMTAAWIASQNSSDADHLRPLHLRDEGLLAGTEVAAGVAEHVGDGEAEDVDDAQEIEDDADEVGRPHDVDLRVAADDDGVGVVARMAPPPGHGIAHDHEAGDLVDGPVPSTAS